MFVVVKAGLIAGITVALMLSLWKSSIGIFLPLVFLWGYSWTEGFVSIQVTALATISAIHLLVMTGAWWLGNRRRETNLAFTGAGITGFSTVILGSLFLGGLLGLFMWWGLIGRLISEPVAIGVKPIAESFLAGFLKLVYGMIMAGVISYMLF